MSEFFTTVKRFPPLKDATVMVRNGNIELRAAPKGTTDWGFTETYEPGNYREIDTGEFHVEITPLTGASFAVS